MKRFTNLLMAGLAGFVPGLELENTNILGYDDTRQLTDFNRFRAELTVEHEEYPDLIGKLIVDNRNEYTTKPSDMHNTTELYRGFVQYRGSEHFFSVGRQRIPLGVGRIWNPIDVFNPIDVEAIETDEREGTDSIRYEYAFSELSNIDATIAQDQVAIRVKGYLEYADVALIGLWDEDNDLEIIGWELEGELPQTGIELRSEGGYFHHLASGDRFTDYIVGAEYGFPNSLTVLAEYRYSGFAKSDYLGAMASYQPAMLWLFNLLLVTSLNDQSGFIAPSVEYSLGDDMTLSAGAFLYFGSDDDEFGQADDRFYLRWFVHF
ncbi:MAG: hypothetical protein D6B25_06435 [Desulfobulbaceae bacterium]|nr:MAG: hypothetical protein D6B25_06435 [Desulfobulbaceae bacterium]